MFFAAVKEFCKSIKNWQSYNLGYGGTLFLTHGVVYSKLCRSAELNLKMLACKQAIFRTTLPHPRSDHAYASYDVGDGCAVPVLVPGVELLSDRSDLMSHC